MENAPMIKANRISKYFGGVRALENVDFELYPNEVVGLAGDNGAGKSTLIKIFSGLFPPNSGEICFEGKKVCLKTARDSERLGIETAYQDLALIETLDIPANIFLGKELTKNVMGNFLLDKRKMMKESQRVLHNLGIKVDSLKVLARYLSGGERQAVAIGRTVYFKAKVVIMDEPTAALGVEERKSVLDLIQRLKQGGASIIIISHNIEDLFAVTDRIYVLKNGRIVGMKITKDTNRDEILRMIVSGIE